ncbi:MAG TPA: hypothetical protein VFS54_09390 [Solirubrobacterales bacterium]|nr:hypothetical protein [Solirubrobacterales bacterium]
MYSKLFSDCLLWLATLGYSPDDLEATQPELTKEIDLIGDSDLAQVLTAANGDETKGFIRLPRARSRVPLLHLKHGEEHGVEILRMTVAIVGTDDGSPVATAWRFESPEGDGDHGFWHCQPVREMRNGRRIAPLSALPAWYFHDTPTLPLQAKDPEQLLTCMLVAIYGLVQLRKMQQESFADQLAAHIRAIDSMNP